LTALRASLFGAFLLFNGKAQGLFGTGCWEQKNRKRAIRSPKKLPKNSPSYKSLLENATGGISKNKLFQIQQYVCRGASLRPEYGIF
jgi:hypothetical protein